MVSEFNLRIIQLQVNFLLIINLKNERSLSEKNFQNEITAVILAGGQALRMDGEDKGLIVFRELPLIAHVINITKLKVS